MKKLIITSSAFEPEEWIPNRNSGFGEDVSPEIHTENRNERKAEELR